MSNPTVSTPIVDKNGKLTTVHKKVDGEAGKSQRVPATISLAVDSPDFEHFNAEEIDRVMPGNPIQQAEDAPGMTIEVDKQSSALLFPRGGKPDVMVMETFFGTRVYVSFGDVDVAHIIATERGDDPTEAKLAEIREEIAPRYEAMKSAMARNGFEIDPDPVEDGKEYWSNSFIIEDRESIDSWSDIAREIEEHGGASELVDFLSEEPDTNLHDILWESLELD
jgi:hypothetical protein